MHCRIHSYWVNYRNLWVVSTTSGSDNLEIENGDEMDIALRVPIEMVLDAGPGYS